jgi:hypothetical protein
MCLFLCLSVCVCVCGSVDVYTSSWGVHSSRYQFVRPLSLSLSLSRARSLSLARAQVAELHVLYEYISFCTLHFIYYILYITYQVAAPHV